MLAEIIANYINKKREIKDLSINDLATKSNSAEGTVKNLCTAKVDNPGLKTMIPIMEVVDGSFDEMLFPDKHKTKIDESSIVALMSAIRETNGEHIHDIRTHYQEHREDMRENYEKRLADKREIIELQKAQIQNLQTTHQKEIIKLEKSNKSKTKIIIALTSIFIVLFFGLFILEMLHPEHGWIRF